MARSGRRTARFLAVVALTLLALTACDLVTDPSPDPTADPTTTEPPTTEAPSDVEPSDAATTEDPSATPPAEEDLPGEAVDGFPEAGVSLAIVGVGATEILNLRIGPGIDFDSIARMPPETSLTATGRNRDLGGSAGTWFQVRAGDDVGWVISSYVSELGASRDVTDRFDPLPRAGSRSALIDEVIAGWSRSRDAIVVYGPVTAGEAMQVRIDVFHGDDDSVLGARLFVVADVDGDRFVVTKVTATQICARGVSGTGDCR